MSDQKYDAVVVDTYSNPIFNGTEEEAAKWLKETPCNESRRVWVAKTMETLTEERFLADTEPPVDVRKIVREELKCMLSALSVTAGKSASASDDAEYAAYRVLATVFRRERGYIDHDWTCPQREYHFSKCTCAIEEKK